MAIYQKMRDCLTHAIKNQQTIEKTCLRTIIGGIQNKSKSQSVEISDAVCYKAVKDAISGNNETLKYRDSDVLKHENDFLSQFLPEMLSADRIKEIIDSSGLKDMPSIMKYLSTNYTGRFDGKLAKKIALDKAC